MINLMPILLMDDDCCDAVLLKRTLKNLGVKNRLVHSFDGIEALEYLRDSANKRPWLIITDLYAPVMNGFDFIRELKSDSNLRQIPVIVFSGSNLQEDVERAFDLGAAGYIEKPATYKELLEVTQTIYNYWSASKLPVALNSPAVI